MTGGVCLIVLVSERVSACSSNATCKLTVIDYCKKSVCV